MLIIDGCLDTEPMAAATTASAMAARISPNDGSMLMIVPKASVKNGLVSPSPLVAKPTRPTMKSALISRPGHRWT